MTKSFNIIKKNNNLLKWPTVLVGIFVCLFIVNFIISITTKYNVFSSVYKFFLNGLGIYTEEVRNIEIKSNDYSNPGSWKIDKSAKWIGKNDVRVTFDLTSIADTYNQDKDIILILDTSSSMFGDKLDELKRNSIGLFDTLLSNNNNRIAIITFNSTSQIVTNFTNDEEFLKESIQNLNANGGTNYNAALLNLDSILDNYTKVDGKDLIVMFLTDGYPVEENPNQISTYNILKNK